MKYLITKILKKPTKTQADHGEQRDGCNEWAGVHG